MFRLKIIHPKPSPTQSEMREFIGQGNVLGGGGPIDSVYEFRFSSESIAEEKRQAVLGKFPQAKAAVYSEKVAVKPISE